MSDIKLFKIINSKATQLSSFSVELEKSLQHTIEHNMEELFGVTFLESEYSTGKVHGGRIDSLGIDENYCPVIFEYKRSTNENVINQGLFYLDWLMDHKAEFELLVLKKLGKDVSEKIEWSGPRLVCIAGGYTNYDQHAVKQINRNIELIRYIKFDDDLLMLELVNATTATENKLTKGNALAKGQYKTVSEYISQLDSKTMDLYESIREYILSLGDDVQEKTLKYYVAYKRIKNFICLEARPQVKNILLYLKIDPSKFQLEDGFSRDASKLGHYGTGDFEITISNHEQFGKAKEYILKSYENG